jgi:DNA-binding transcriptional ArsR family regulator
MSDTTIGNSATRVLLAVLSGASTYRELVKVTGSRPATVNYHLKRLRDAGLVEWDPRCQGTLRSAVSVVALTSEAGR